MHSEKYGHSGGGMFSIRKAVKEDFEAVYPLLFELNSTQLTKDDWRRLFINHCGTDENYYGHILLNRDVVIGFLGLIFSHRLIDGTVQKFCNMTSWIIKKEYRGKGLGRFMLQHLLHLKEYTIVDLTATNGTVNLLKEYGFKELETEYVIIPPFPGIGYVTNRCSVLVGHDAVISSVDKENSKIYHDHKTFKCIHVVLKTPHEYCYIIAVKVIRKKKFIFAEIHYISNIQMFIKHIQHVRISLCLRLRVCGLLLEKRILRGYEIKSSVIKSLPPVRFYKSDVLDKSRITDNLYTELLVIDH